MTLDDLPWTTGTDPAVLNGAKGRKCRRHEWERTVAGIPWPARCRVCRFVTEDPDAYFFPADFDAEMIPEAARCLGTTDGAHQPETRVRCSRCSAVRDPAVSLRSRNNGKRGRRAELTIAREIPGARKMGTWRVAKIDAILAEIAEVTKLPALPAELTADTLSALLAAAEALRTICADDDDGCECSGCLAEARLNGTQRGMALS